MDHCPNEPRIGLFHDGELSDDERVALEEHLAGCPRCAAVLAELAAISRVLKAASCPAPSPGWRRRLEAIPQSEGERILLRTAGALTAVAASLLVAGVVWLWSNRSVPAPPAWEVAAVAVEPAVAEDPDVQLAAWVASDLAARPAGRADGRKR